MRHAHAAADRDIPARDVAGRVDDGDEAEIVGERVDVVRGRDRDDDFEFARQVSLAVDRLDHIFLAAGDLLAVEPDFTVGRRLRRQALGNGTRQRQCAGMRARLLRNDPAHDVTIDVAAGGDGIEHRIVNRLHRQFQVRFDHTVQLHGLPRGQPHGAVAVIARHLIERQPLLRREHAAGNADADHEGKGLFHFLARALGPQVAVVLQIHAVEFDQLLVVLGDGSGDLLG